MARGLIAAAKDKEKLTHSPLLILPASQSAGAISSSIKIEDCYIKEVYGDKWGIVASNSNVRLVRVLGYLDGSGSDVSGVCAGAEFLYGDRVLFVTVSWFLPVVTICGCWYGLEWYLLSAGDIQYYSRRRVFFLP